MTPLDINTIGILRLAGLAGCSQPEGPESHGAEFLRRVADAYEEARDEILADDTNEPLDWYGVSPVAANNRDNARDEAVMEAPSRSRSAGYLWREFIDVGGYDERPEVDPCESMTAMAQSCLEQIAGRLWDALFELDTEHFTEEN